MRDNNSVITPENKHILFLLLCIWYCGKKKGEYVNIYSLNMEIIMNHHHHHLYSLS